MKSLGTKTKSTMLFIVVTKEKYPKCPLIGNWLKKIMVYR